VRTREPKRELRTRFANLPLAKDRAAAANYNSLVADISRAECD